MQTLPEVIDSIAARTYAPGGGATAAIAGALGAAQLAMVARYVRVDARELDEAAHRLLHLADEDARAYAASRQFPGDETKRRRIVDVPLLVVATADAVLERATGIRREASEAFTPDLDIACACLRACRDGAAAIARINDV